MTKPCVLSIAGSDPSGGAGIQADIQACSYAGVHGLSILTAITAQNTEMVARCDPVSVDLIAAQLLSIFDEFDIAAVKTGVLFDEEIIALVTSYLRKHHLRPIVDPVAIASSGSNLSRVSMYHGLVNELLPQSLMLIANVPEAVCISRNQINSLRDMKRACETLYSYGSEYVVLKGGHLGGKTAVDVVYDGKYFFELNLPRYKSIQLHGSGCNFASLVAAFIAKGDDPLLAVKKAKMHLWCLFAHRYTPGTGAAVVDYHPKLPPFEGEYTENQGKIISELYLAVKQALSLIPAAVIPEVGMNFCYALPNAKSLNDVCGLDGRIVKTQHTAQCCGKLCFGGSKHVATIVLTVMHTDPTTRSIINLKYSEAVIKACRKSGLVVGSFSRENEPISTISSMEWGTQVVINDLGRVPDVIYDTGGMGKEPMVRVIGSDPSKVLSKIKEIIRNYNSTR
ncbi:MAG: bifunctional hydroxymethylpyrimidine kinase/phosphomethylpyrimidine kinase [Candidatus Thermoplasmatota archaeon]|nr:bifunctional hydroxymethylpyrimidine kinase/phosphomethylpyrimidine kinase [Candidatus Thermoplasmatota archaeon]MBU1941488.1 bifunctional hydroxymethylpyrimidine kinase/phosphomethylpyrimidine kinase [Candidatus Thermoplasmatota archaeon]